MAGNIIHAIATTNAIISGLIVIEACKVLSGQVEKTRDTFCVQHPSARGKMLVPVEPQPPNAKCYVCSQVSFRAPSQFGPRPLTTFTQLSRAYMTFERLLVSIWKHSDMSPPKFPYVRLQRQSAKARVDASPSLVYRAPARTAYASEPLAWVSS